MKVMAGTQMLLPTSPTFLPVVHLHLPRPHSRHHFHPSSSLPSAPPGSPIRAPSPRRAVASSGLLQEASAACTKLMHVAAALERRRNAERRIARRTRPDRAPASVVCPAATSTAPSARDSSHCRVATVRTPRPLPPHSLDLVGLVVDAPSHSLLPAADVAPSPLRNLAARTYIDAGTEPPPPPMSCDAAVHASPPPRSFCDVAVGNDDNMTTYGVISDPFARDLARMLPWSRRRECALAQAIWLGDWRSETTMLERMHPVFRVYLHALFMFFRPTTPLAQEATLPPGFAPVLNLFTHWFTRWNAVPTPDGSVEPDIRFRYYPLTYGQLHGTAPLHGRGLIIDYASSFS
ncbi:hypothetical protein DFH06DRAFT_1334369 [Mycena polygramma]|nr:hypothetical protein DFH06DRAFT_1334369 [Mycena polygramma]